MHYGTSNVLYRIKKTNKLKSLMHSESFVSDDMAPITQLEDH